MCGAKFAPCSTSPLTRYGYVGRRTGTLVSHAARSLALHWNGLGALSRVSCGDGALVCVALSGGPTPTPDTMVVSVPAYWAAFARPAYRVQAFQGTLLTDKADATGTYFRRNRHYDPVSARFTQEDPIGLAGGLNLYGFAGGDPVNFGDPLGLCPEKMGGDGKSRTLSDCPEGTAGRRKYISGAAVPADDPLCFIFGGLEVRGGIGIGREAYKHVVQRHAWFSSARASRFNPGERIPELIRAAEGVMRSPARGTAFQRTVNAGREIGIDRTTGQPTSWYTVLTDRFDNLTTAHPGLPRR